MAAETQPSSQKLLGRSSVQRGARGSPLNAMVDLVSAMIRQDYIKRLIEQVGEAIARALGKTGASAQEQEEALQRVTRAYAELGIVPGFFELEDTSLRRMLGSPERIQAVAELCAWEAQLLELKGETARAAQRRRLARALSAG